MARLSDDERAALTHYMRGMVDRFTDVALRATARAEEKIEAEGTTVLAARMLAMAAAMQAIGEGLLANVADGLETGEEWRALVQEPRRPAKADVAGRIAA